MPAMPILCPGLGAKLRKPLPADTSLALTKSGWQMRMAVPLAKFGVTLPPRQAIKKTFPGLLLRNFGLRLPGRSGIERNAAV